MMAMFLAPWPAALAREIVFELDVEQPVHALYAPVTASSVSGPVDIERSRRDIEARLERAAIGIFDARKDLDEGLYVGEARLHVRLRCESAHRESRF
jgi:hypothetical protein